MPAYGLGTYGLGQYGIGQGSGPAPPITGSTVYPDVMADFKVWLKNHPDLVPVIAGRVFFRVPYKGDQLAVGGFPFLRIYAILEQPSAQSDFQWITETVSIEVWGQRASDWPTLRNLKTLITQAMQDLGLQGSTRINPAGSTVTLDASITFWRDDVDPETGFPRIIANGSIDAVGVAAD
jgi:hypothetical protein